MGKRREANRRRQLQTAICSGAVCHTPFRPPSPADGPCGRVGAGVGHGSHSEWGGGGVSSGKWALMPPPPRVALEGKGPQRRSHRRLGRRLKEVAEAVGGGYCRIQMPWSLAAVRHWLSIGWGPWRGGGGQGVA